MMSRRKESNPEKEVVYTSDKTWKGKKILSDETEINSTPIAEFKSGTVYVERNGVGYCYRNGELVHTMKFKESGSVDSSK